MQCGLIICAADQFACVTHNIKSLSNQHAKTESIYKSLILSTGGVPTPETHSPVSRCCASLLASQVAAQYQKYVFSELKLWINNIHANTWSTLHWPHVCSTHIMGLHNFLFMTMRTKLWHLPPLSRHGGRPDFVHHQGTRMWNIRHGALHAPRTIFAESVHGRARDYIAQHLSWATRRTNLTGCRQII